MSSFKHAVQGVSLRLKPDSIVGRRYEFATTWSNSQIVIKGLVTQYLWSFDGNLYYVAKGDQEKPVTVFGLVRAKGEWRLQARLNHAVMYLSGRFTLL